LEVAGFDVKRFGAAPRDHLRTRNKHCRHHTECPRSGWLNGAQGQFLWNAKAESLLKTLKIEAVYSMAFESLDRYCVARF
jgi:hypothetical protein